MTFRITLILFFLFVTAHQSTGQQRLIEIGESMEEYIKENHVENVEKIIHQLASSEQFLKKLLEQGHDIDPNQIHIKRKDVKVGEDVDIFVKHFSEHQNFTMFLVPINFYSHAIYDTLLISVLEVSDHWLQRKHYYSDLKNDSIRSELLSLENHAFLAEHMYHQALRTTNLDVAEVQVKLNESYISNNSVHMGLGKLTNKEKKEFRETWGMMRKLLSHNVELYVEMNVYVFGTDDMKIDVTYNQSEKTYTVTPSNIFTRHHFEE